MTTSGSTTKHRQIDGCSEGWRVESSFFGFFFIIYSWQAVYGKETIDMYCGSRMGPNNKNGNNSIINPNPLLPPATFFFSCANGSHRLLFYDYICGRSVCGFSSASVSIPLSLPSLFIYLGEGELLGHGHQVGLFPCTGHEVEVA